MLNFNAETLVILAHIDDEFAISPIIKKIAKKNPNNIKIIYCAERYTDPLLTRQLRREESIKSMSLLEVDKKNIDFLNNYFFINDLQLYISAPNIYSFLENFMKEFNFKQILTLNYEGGHPDHDALALLVYKFSKNNEKNPIFFPAYNSRKTLGIPVSVFRPLRKQESYFSSIKLDYFCWIDTLKIAFIYKTEWKAFIKLFPFIFLNFIGTNKIYFSNIILLKNVDWNKSLSYKIYKGDLKKIMDSINKKS